MATRRSVFAVIGFILLIFACIFRFILGKKTGTFAFSKKEMIKGSYTAEVCP